MSMVDVARAATSPVPDPRPPLWVSKADIVTGPTGIPNEEYEPFFAGRSTLRTFPLVANAAVTTAHVTGTPSAKVTLPATEPALPKAGISFTSAVAPTAGSTLFKIEAVENVASNTEISRRPTGTVACCVGNEVMVTPKGWPAAPKLVTDHPAAPATLGISTVPRPGEGCAQASAGVPPCPRRQS